MEEVDNQYPERQNSHNKDNHSGDSRQEIFSKVVRAGKRTYFFDVKATRGNDYYLTITESKKRFNKDGRFFYEKHKLFLYKEDFDKFEDGLTETIAKIKELRIAAGDHEDPNYNRNYDNNKPSSTYDSDKSEDYSSANEDEPASESSDESAESSKFTEVSFDDLGSSDTE